MIFTDPAFIFSEPIVTFFRHHYRFVFLFQFILIFILLFRSKLHKIITSLVVKNYKYLIFLVLISLTFSMSNMPLKTLVHFDEENFLLQTRNTVLHGENALCYQKINNECVDYFIPPHGIGASSFYSFFFIDDFIILKFIVAVFNSIFLVLAAILLFFTVSTLFPKDKVVKYILPIILVFLPYNNIFSTSLLSPSISLFFISLAIYVYVNLKSENGCDSSNCLINYSIILLSCIVAASFRVELILFLILILIHALFNIKKVSKFEKSIDNQLLVLVLLILIIISGLYSILYFNQKIVNGNESSFGTQYLNTTYLSYNISSPILILITFFAGITLFRRVLIIIKTRKISFLTEFEALMIFIYLFYIILYSFYNYTNVYRFLIPISGVFLLLAAESLVYVSSYIRKNSRSFWIILFCIFIISTSVMNSYSLKSKIYEHNKYALDFVEFIRPSNLYNIEGVENVSSVFVFLGEYLGDFVNLENYVSPKVHWQSYDNPEIKFYFVDSPFLTYENSHFYKQNFTSIKLDSGQSKYSIYEVILSDVEN